MFPLFDPEYASPATKERIAEHNEALAQIEVAMAEAERIAERLEQADPMLVDPGELETKVRAGRNRQHQNRKARIGLLQSRLPILQGLEQDRAAAEQDAELALAAARKKTEEALRALGYGAMLADTDPVTRLQVAQLVDFAQPVAAAVGRYQGLREARAGIVEERIRATREIKSLTEKIKEALEAAVFAPA